MKYIFLGLVLCGCAELRVLTPAPVVQPPEVGGETFKWRLEGGFLEGEMYEITGNAGSRPPNLNAPETDDSFFVPLGASVGFGNWFDLGLGFYASEMSGGYVRGQIQLVGAGVRSAKAGNFSLSVFGRGNYSTGENEGDQSETFGAGGYPWSAEARVLGSEAGGSLGYRFTDSFMIFAGAARGWHDGEGKIKQNAAGADPGGAYETKFTGQTDSVQLGLNAGREGTLSLTGGYYESEFSNVARRYWTAVNFLIQVPIGK